MAKINGLDKMTYAELRELRDRIDEAMIEAQATEKRALREKLEALAANSGFSIAELMGVKRGAGKSALKSSKVAVKYRNPKDASQTWAGRGRKPTWLVEATKRGQKIESFLA